IDNDVVRGYRGCLVDGMLNSGFSSNALVRRNGNKFGYYLHLHGSPLFVTDADKIIKLPRHTLTEEMNEQSQHLVLTHVKHKTSVIAASSVLSTYCDYLQFSLSEAEDIVLFGYSGVDSHLNILLHPYLTKENLRIVEWAGAGDYEIRNRFWRDTFGQPVSLVQ